MTDIGEYVSAGEDAILIHLARVMCEAARVAHAELCPDEEPFGTFDTIGPKSKAKFLVVAKAAYAEVIKLAK